ncbi:MAG: hypothetical protein ACI4KR_04770 [Ruminiclostridium sp.]
MKYQKISKFIKKRKLLFVGRSAGGEQWISDGCAAFPIIGMPNMNDNEILTFLGFSDDDNISVYDLPCEDRLTDTADGEELIKDFGPVILSRDNELQSLYTSLGALLINSAYITPLYTQKGEGELRYYLRLDRNRAPMIAVKKGLYLIALIYPVATWTKGEDIADRYRKFVERLSVANFNFGEDETDEPEEDEEDEE